MNTKQLDDELVSLLAVSFSLLAFLNTSWKEPFSGSDVSVRSYWYSIPPRENVFYIFHSKHCRLQRSNLNIGTAIEVNLVFVSTFLKSSCFKNHLVTCLSKKANYSCQDTFLLFDTGSHKGLFPRLLSTNLDRGYKN